MQCPKCRVALLASEREGIEIDCCPQCGGIWLDHGELRDMILVYAPQFAGQQQKKIKKEKLMKISEYFEKDHDRLDELFHNFQEWKRKDYPRAREFFVSFKFGLQRHIIWEEEILFPLFEKKTGMTEGGPTAVMRMEHRQIGQFLEALHTKAKASDRDSDQEEQALIQVLSMHNMKEENVLYPAIDAHAEEADVRAVFEQMDAIPPERYEQCCQPTPQIP